MIRLNKTKRSKYILYIGYALEFYCDTWQEANNTGRMYGNYTIEEIRK